MGQKHRLTERSQIQARLVELRVQITAWYMDEKVPAIDIVEKLKPLGLDLTIGQVHYAIHRFELNRPRNTMTAKHLAALRAREHLPKTCRHCGDEYTPNSGKQIFCLDCVPNASFNRRVKNYGIGKKEFDAMFASQNGLCGICNEPMDPLEAAVDHDHSSGQIRGLLCRPCNLKLCVVEDETFTLRAQEYLKCSATKEYGTVKPA